MTTLLVTCPTHNLTWDMDFDPPQCNCYDTILEIVEDDDPQPPRTTPLEDYSFLAVLDD